MKFILLMLLAVCAAARPIADAKPLAPLAAHDVAVPKSGILFDPLNVLPGTESKDMGKPDGRGVARVTSKAKRMIDSIPFIGGMMGGGGKSGGDFPLPIRKRQMEMLAGLPIIGGMMGGGGKGGGGGGLPLPIRKRQMEMLAGLPIIGGMMGGGGKGGGGLPLPIRKRQMEMLAGLPIIGGMMSGGGKGGGGLPLPIRKLAARFSGGDIDVQGNIGKSAQPLSK